MHACGRRICLWRLFRGALRPCSWCRWRPRVSASYTFCFITCCLSVVIARFFGSQEQARLFIYVWCYALCVHRASSCFFRPHVSRILHDGFVVGLLRVRACVSALFSWRLHTSPRRNIGVCMRSSSLSWCSSDYLDLLLQHTFCRCFVACTGFTVSCLSISLSSSWAVWVDVLLTLPNSGAKIHRRISGSEKAISAFILLFAACFSSSSFNPPTLSIDTRDTSKKG